jgi:excisionase family DNA binding protein
MGSNYLTIEEVCELTHLSRSTIYKLTSTCQIPHYKKGKLLFIEKEIHEWISKWKRETVDDMQQDVDNHFSLLNRLNHGK